MPRTFHKTIFQLGLVLLFVAPTFFLNAQQLDGKISLISYLGKLETEFAIKFSYVDDVLGGINVTIPKAKDLTSILSDLSSQTGLQIKKLDLRYYTVSKNRLVDICGSVLDNFAKNSIPGATIELLGTERALVTNMDGSFSLKQVPREASLKIRYLGYITQYKTVEELLTAAGCTKILLAQNYERLEEVTVYEFLTSGITKQQDGSTTLETAMLGTLPGLTEPDILQSVQALPGIRSIDETVSDINVRGGTNDQNLILWNGIKMYQSGHFFGLISAFNPYLTDKVTVYKNGTPSKFGDGVSSVIHIQTNDEIEDSFQGGGGFNFISADIFGQLPLKDNLALQFSARRSTTDFLNTPTYNSFTDRAFQDTEVRNQLNQQVDDVVLNSENFFFYDVTAKLLYDVNPDQKIRMNFIGIANKLSFGQFNETTGEDSASLLDQNNVSAGLQWYGKWLPNFTTDLNIYVSRYNLFSENRFNSQQQLFQENIVEERAVKLDTRYEINNRLTSQNGYQYIETGITNTTDINNPPFASNVKGVIRIHAPYTQLLYTSKNNLFSANGGIRVNYIENLGTFSEFLIEPRLNLNFKLFNYVRAEILGEFKSQSTNQVIDLEQNFLGVEKRRWILSDNNALPITRSKQGSAGINYAKNSIYLGVEGFYKEVEGISTRTQGFQNQNQFNGEIGGYRVKGIEFLINKRGLNYSSWLSYTYNSNTYTFNSIVPPQFPNNLDVRHSVTFAATYDLKQLKLGASLNYRSGRPFTRPDANDPLDTNFFPSRINFEPPNSSRLPAYLRLDTSATYSFTIGEHITATTGASILNLTDKRNILNRYSRVSSDNELETVDNISLGFTPNISFRVRF